MIHVTVSHYLNHDTTLLKFEHVLHIIIISFPTANNIPTVKNDLMFYQMK